MRRLSVESMLNEFMGKEKGWYGLDGGLCEENCVYLWSVLLKKRNSSYQYEVVG